jgi:hypothetical protein
VHEESEEGEASKDDSKDEGKNEKADTSDDSKDADKSEDSGSDDGDDKGEDTPSTTDDEGYELPSLDAPSQTNKNLRKGPGEGQKGSRKPTEKKGDKDVSTFLSISPLCLCTRLRL